MPEWVYVVLCVVGLLATLRLYWFAVTQRRRAEKWKGIAMDRMGGTLTGGMDWEEDDD